MKTKIKKTKMKTKKQTCTATQTLGLTSPTLPLTKLIFQALQSHVRS